MSEEHAKKRARVEEAPDSIGQPAAKAIQARLPDFKPEVGMILGSGMGGVADIIEDKTVIPFGELPNFPVSTVEGHHGNLILGSINGVSVVCLQGRVHLYEGGDPRTIRVPIYTMKLLGCDYLILTSAVGSLKEEAGPAELVCLTDHINFQGRNPLTGPNDPIGPRFPSLLNAYDPDLRAALHKIAAGCDIKLHNGVYCATSGPAFETPAEIRCYKTLGADVVGMSVVGEVMSARHCGLRCLAVSIVVNYASGMTDNHITHDETLHFSKKAETKVTKLMTEFLGKKADWDKPPTFE